MVEALVTHCVCAGVDWPLGVPGFFPVGAPLQPADTAEAHWLVCLKNTWSKGPMMGYRDPGVPPTHVLDTNMHLSSCPQSNLFMKDIELNIDCQIFVPVQACVCVVMVEALVTYRVCVCVCVVMVEAPVTYRVCVCAW